MSTAIICLCSQGALGNVTVSFSSLPLSKAMKEIEKVSKLHFLYKSDLPGLDNSRSLSVKDASERDALDRLFAGTGLKY